MVEANNLVTGRRIKTSEKKSELNGSYAACRELSSGKDTPSGHWEMMGLPVMFDWGYFPNIENCFPEALIRDFVRETGLGGVLGNCHSSGTEIISRLGKKHQKTGYPICYTSADSVFQIAAHEESFGLKRLYQVCDVARNLLDKYNIGRVIARPFTGETGNYIRTGNRKDYTTPPHGKTLLDNLVEGGREVHSIGKIADIFAHRGITHKRKASGHSALFLETIEAMKTAEDGSLIFTNFVEFDQTYGHRRDVGGYAAALEHFDKNLPLLIEQMRENDLLVLSADHGCDPTWRGSDHTRECVPFITHLSGQTESFNAGLRESFCDIGQSIAHHLRIEPLKNGVSIF